MLLDLFRDNRYACYVPKPLIVELFANWQETGRRFIGPIGHKKSTPSPIPNFVIVDSKLC